MIKIYGPYNPIKDMILNPSNPLHGKALLLTASTPLLLNGDQFEAVVSAGGSAQFQSEFSLSDAMSLNASSAINFNNYPWWVKLTDAQLEQNVPNCMPLYQTVSIAGETSPITWKNWKYRTYILDELGLNKNYYGDLGSSLPVSVAVILDNLGYNIATQAERQADQPADQPDVIG